MFQQNTGCWPANKYLGWAFQKPSLSMVVSILQAVTCSSTISRHWRVKPDTFDINNPKNENPSCGADPSFMPFTDTSKWHFDIDRYLNHIVPAPRWRLVPYPVSYFLGYRKGNKVDRIGNIAMTFWAFVGIFVAILLIELAMRSISVVEESGILIIASFVSPGSILSSW